MEELATRMVQIANRIGQRETDCKDGCRAAPANLDGTVADVDHIPENPRATSVGRADRHDGVAEAWQAGCIYEVCVERVGAGHVALHRTEGQEPGACHEEISRVGNSCHERGLARRPGARQQLHHADPARGDSHRNTKKITHTPVLADGITVVTGEVIRQK